MRATRLINRAVRRSQREVALILALSPVLLISNSTLAESPDRAEAACLAKANVSGEGPGEKIFTSVVGTDAKNRLFVRLSWAPRMAFECHFEQGTMVSANHVHVLIMGPERGENERNRLRQQQEVLERQRQEVEAQRQRLLQEAEARRQRQRREAEIERQKNR